MIPFEDKEQYSYILKKFLVVKINNNFNKPSDFIKKLDKKIHHNYVYRLYEEDFLFSPTLYAFCLLASAFDMEASEFLREFEVFYNLSLKNRKCIDK